MVIDINPPVVQLLARSHNTGVILVTPSTNATSGVHVVCHPAIGFGVQVQPVILIVDPFSPVNITAGVVSFVKYGAVTSHHTLTAHHITGGIVSRVIDDIDHDTQLLTKSHATGVTNIVHSVKETFGIQETCPEPFTGVGVQVQSDKVNVEPLSDVMRIEVFASFV
jgi:hypothetical protein